MKKRLSEMGDEDIEPLLVRLGKLIDRALPPGNLGGAKCGYLLALVDAPKGSSQVATGHFISNLDREITPEVMHELADMVELEMDAEDEAIERETDAPQTDWSTVCIGMGGPAAGPKCCGRAGEYSGFASGPTSFTCPKGCSCHD